MWLYVHVCDYNLSPQVGGSTDMRTFLFQTKHPHGVIFSNLIYLSKPAERRTSSLLEYWVSRYARVSLHTRWLTFLEWTSHGWLSKLYQRNTTRGDVIFSMAWYTVVERPSQVSACVFNQHDGHECMSLYIEKKIVCYVLLVWIRHMILPSTNEGGLDFTPCGRIQYVYIIIS